VRMDFSSRLTLIQREHSVIPLPSGRWTSWRIW
jgi:hypothetical protein